MCINIYILADMYTYKYTNNGCFYVCTWTKNKFIFTSLYKLKIWIPRSAIKSQSLKESGSTADELPP